jgi:hypothetical protein
MRGIRKLLSYAVAALGLSTYSPPLSIGELAMAAVLNHPSQNTLNSPCVKPGTRVQVIEDFAEVSQQLFESTRRATMALHFTVPAAARSILDQFQFPPPPFAQTWRVFRGGDEFGTAEIEIALTWSLLWQPQAMAQLQLRLEEIRLEPIYRFWRQPA